MKYLFPLSIFLLLAGCSQTTERKIASDELGIETIPPEEAEATKEILQLVAKGYSHRRPTVKDPEALRIIHAKAHGCVHAEFRVLKDIPEDFRHGVFAESKTFPAWVRLSNGSGAPQHDGLPDGRGLAVKLMEVVGEKLGQEKSTQDFLLQSAPNFFAKDVAAYVKFMKQAAHPGPKGIAEMLKDVHLREKVDRESMQILASSADNPKNPLSAVYYSALPQKLGPHAIKLKARQCPEYEAMSVSFRNRFKKDHLKNIMAAQLSESDACIELMVQVQIDSQKMPVENAMVTWSEELSPFVPVARMIIPQQSFGSRKRQEFCQHVSFNPWHTLSEHRPLGGLNRVRKLVYEHSQGHRHSLNNKASFEPQAGQIHD